MELHRYIMRLQIVIVPFALYVCAMASREKMSSGNADTTFVSNCDHDYSYIARIQSTVGPRLSQSPLPEPLVI